MYLPPAARSVPWISLSIRDNALLFEAEKDNKIKAIPAIINDLLVKRTSLYQQTLFSKAPALHNRLFMRLRQVALTRLLVWHL